MNVVVWLLRKGATDQFLSYIWVEIQSYIQSCVVCLGKVGPVEIFLLQPMISNLKTRIAYGNVVVDTIRVTLHPVHSFQSSKPSNQWYRHHLTSRTSSYGGQPTQLCKNAFAFSRRSILIFSCLVCNPPDCLTRHITLKIHVTEINRLHVTIRTLRVIIKKYLQTSIC